MPLDSTQGKEPVKVSRRGWLVGAGATLLAGACSDAPIVAQTSDVQAQPDVSVDTAPEPVDCTRFDKFREQIKVLLEEAEAVAAVGEQSRLEDSLHGFVFPPSVWGEQSNFYDTYGFEKPKVVKGADIGAFYDPETGKIVAFRSRAVGGSKWEKQIIVRDIVDPEVDEDGNLTAFKAHQEFQMISGFEGSKNGLYVRWETGYDNVAEPTEFWVSDEEAVISHDGQQCEMNAGHGPIEGNCPTENCEDWIAEVGDRIKAIEDAWNL